MRAAELRMVGNLNFIFISSLCCCAVEGSGTRRGLEIASPLAVSTTGSICHAVKLLPLLGHAIAKQNLVAHRCESRRRHPTASATPSPYPHLLLLRYRPASPDAYISTPNKVSFSRVHVEFYTKAFFVALVALVAYGLLLVVQPFAGPMTWAIFLAFMLYPFHLWLSRKLRGRAGTSAGIITGLTPFALLTPLTLLGIEFARQARGLVEYVQSRNFHLDGDLLLRLETYPVIGPVARLAREELAVSVCRHPGLAGEWHPNNHAHRGFSGRRLRVVGARHGASASSSCCSCCSFSCVTARACSTGFSG